MVSNTSMEILENPPLVSIVINNYNYGHFLYDAINSALAQTYSKKEVIVVDDGSTDNSRQIIGSYGKRIIPILKKNGGQPSTFNSGFAKCKGEIICFLDSDDIFMSKKVEQVVQVFKKFKDIGWCFHKMKRVNTLTNTSYGSGPRQAPPSSVIDYRSQVARGKLGSFTPATSGLCFTRQLLLQILPMPEWEGVAADRYINPAALALSKGYFLSKELAVLRIHNDNAYTFRIDNRRRLARDLVLAARWFSVNFKILRNVAKNFMGMGIGLYWLTGGVDHNYKKDIDYYLCSTSLREKVEIHVRAIYHFGRSKFKGRKNLS